MAKKKKFKLTGQLRAQLLSQSVKTADLPTRNQAPSSHNEPSHHIDKKPVAKPGAHPVDAHVLADIKHIGMVVGVLAIILVVIAIVDSRMHLSLTIGQKITHVLGI